MRRHFLTGTVIVGSLLVLAACDDPDTIESNDTSRLVTTAAYRAPAEPGNGKASMFGVPREARILFW
jgi:hypothetical protein